MTTKLKEIKWEREQLWKGCILASIAHAIMVAHYPDFANEHSWDGINYSVQDNEGARGTITFHPRYCIAAFRDDNSERAKIVRKASEYFKGASKEVLDIAESEALQYLLDSVNGKTISVITSAFWGESRRLYSNDEYDDMYEHGGFLLSRQTMELNDSIEAWKEYYDMTDEQCRLLESLFTRKVSNPTQIIVLTKKEIIMLGTDEEEGLKESEISFNELGIIWQE
jgi:hypothetical protein